MNRINAAYDSGPDLLIQTIEQDLGIPINHYIEVDFPGFSGMVNALGGVTMDFPTEVKDAVQRPRRHHHWLPGGQRDHGLAARAQPAPLLQELRRQLGVRRPIGLQPHPATGRLLPGRAGQDKLVDHQPAHHQHLHRRRSGQPDHRRHPDPRATSLHIADVFRGLHLVAPGHRDTADRRLRHRRRGRRTERGAALRPERDQRLQPDRDERDDARRPRRPRAASRPRRRPCRPRPTAWSASTCSTRRRSAVSRTPPRPRSRPRASR